LHLKPGYVRQQTDRRSLSDDTQSRKAGLVTRAVHAVVMVIFYNTDGMRSPVIRHSEQSTDKANSRADHFASPSLKGAKNGKR
jgi:hypothetical protein